MRHSDHYFVDFCTENGGYYRPPVNRRNRLGWIVYALLWIGGAALIYAGWPK
jgi:hypothetical protein